MCMNSRTEETRSKKKKKKKLGQQQKIVISEWSLALNKDFTQGCLGRMRTN